MFSRDALAALTLQPAFRLMTHYGNEALEAAQCAAPVIGYADPANCSLQFERRQRFRANH
ncbi:hypothetical protein PQR75_38565 [Paraburkholderia fungorum]|uniref:hypothetical protein n=1 Tax=Paraburkholderia fungorum TaxID=134537 RepID=UPI0038B9BE2A